VKKSIGMIGLAAAGALPAPAFAQALVLPDSGDTAWLLTASVLALMTILPGLALLHAGRGTARHALSAFLQCFAIAAAVSLLFAVIGYSLAFGPGTALIGGGGNLFLSNLGDVREGLLVPESAFALFQMMLAIVAPVLLAGATAGRARLPWVIGMALVWSLIVYAPIAHWLWGGGWLAGLGAVDFGGGLVIHASAGVSALVLVKLLGPRTGWGSTPLPAHARALMLTGAGLAWLGFFGLAGGWAMSATDDAATALINTHLGACAAGLGWMLAERLRTGRISASGFALGALTGIAAVASSAVYVAPLGAIATGLIAAVLAFFAARILRRWLRADDPLHLFAVHGIGGIAGALLLAAFVFPALGGPGLEGGGTVVTLLVGQGVAVVTVAAWSVIGTLIAALGVAMVLPMRVTPAEEAERDASAHQERAWEWE